MIDPWIQTSLGLAVDLLDPQPEQFNLLDIAIALSNTNRFCGHLGPLSVGIHSLVVGDFLRDTAGESAAAWGYYHDASEAYLGDVTAPLKRVLPMYGAIENRMQRAICKKFLGEASPTQMIGDQVKDADMRSLALERSLFGVDEPRSWGYYVESFEPLPEKYLAKYWSKRTNDIADILYFRLINASKVSV